MQTLAAVMPLPVVVVQVLVVSLIHFWTNADGKLFICLDRDRTRAKKDELSGSTVTSTQAAQSALNFNSS